MAPGTLRNSVMNNLEVHGNFYHDPVNRYLDYCSFNRSNLIATGIEITQPEGEAAVAETHTDTPTPTAITATTLIANAVNTFAGDGSAATEVYLPSAIKGTHICLEITGDIDEAGGIFMRCAPAGSSTKGLDRYAGLHTIIVKILWKSTGPGTPLPTGCTAYAKMAGTVKIPTNTELIYQASTANNWLGIGSEIHFFCPKQGQWIAKISAIPDGTGANGALSVGTTALV